MNHCLHPSMCNTPAVGMVRTVKRATGEGGIVGAYCPEHLYHPAETFPDLYVFEYLPLVEG